MNTFYKLLIALLVAILCVKAVDVQTEVPAYSQTGSSGTEVEEIQRVLKERGLSPFRQILLENLAFFLFFFSFLIILLIVIFVPVSKIFSSFLSVVFALIPLVILIVCFAKFIFEVSGNLLNGSLLYFFSTLILCYFGGCFYPISTFPEFFQNIASWLPSGIALNYGASLLKGKTIVPELFGLLGYSVAFLAFTIFYRQLKIKEQI